MARMRYRSAAASGKLAAATILALAASLVCAAGASAAGGVTVMTPSLDFGRAVIGSAGTVTKNVELYNSTSSTLQLTAMQLSGAISDFVPSFANGTTCPTPDAGHSAGVGPGATCSVTVTYTPATLGAVSGSLDMTFCPTDATSCLTTSNVTLAAEGVQAETLSLAPTALRFTSTRRGTSSATQTVTLTNGPEPMSINGLSLGGGALHDFAIGRDGCTGSDLSPGASCTFNVRFTPSQTGTRTATVTVLGATVGNTYPTLTLTGTGLPASSGTKTAPTAPSTPTTRPGSGGTKAAGGGGPYDDFEIVTCRTVTIRRPHAPHKVKALRCTARRVVRSVTFTADAARTRATISRGSVVYARGWASSRGINRWQLMIHRLRPLRRGGYMLTLRTRHGVRRLSLRVT